VRLWIGSLNYFWHAYYSSIVLASYESFSETQFCFVALLVLDLSNLDILRVVEPPIFQVLEFQYMH
jgi:hypothetical protein